jgi:hypothetical protein
MARPKKVAEEKAKEGATLSIDVDSFVRTRDSVSLIPVPHSSSSSSSSKTRRIRHGQRCCLKTTRHHGHRPSPPHLNNHPSYTFGRLDSYMLTPPRPYPERIIVVSS